MQRRLDLVMIREVAGVMAETYTPREMLRSRVLDVIVWVLGRRFSFSGLIPAR